MKKVTILVFLVSCSLVGFSQSKKGTIRSKAVFEQDFEKGGGKKIAETKEEYDSQGNVIKEYDYNKEGNLKEYVVYNYKNNQIQSEITYDPNGKIVKKVVYTYNAQGDKTTKNTYNGKEELVKKKTYVYEYRE